MANLELSKQRRGLVAIRWSDGSHRYPARSPNRATKRHSRNLPCRSLGSSCPRCDFLRTDFLRMPGSGLLCNSSGSRVAQIVTSPEYWISRQCGQPEEQWKRPDRTETVGPPTDNLRCRAFALLTSHRSFAILLWAHHRGTHARWQVRNAPGPSRFDGLEDPRSHGAVRWL